MLGYAEIANTNSGGFREVKKTVLGLGLKSSKNDVPTRPFLRWAGGKYHLASTLMEYAPLDVRERVYYEPFLGAGALFFAMSHGDAHLSDLNGHLIGCYKEIRDNPRAVYNALQRHAMRDSEDYYYATREIYNQSPTGIARAARFLYLNRTCFNGVFRVNMKGAFNVPYGHKETPRFPSLPEILQVSLALQKATLKTQDYEKAISSVRKGSFVYLDPPYPPLNGTSYFTHYTPDRFSGEDQEGVAICAEALNKRGSLFLLSNADTPLIRKLYAGFEIYRLSVTRFVSSSREKHRVGEVLISNYRLPPRGRS